MEAILLVARRAMDGGMTTGERVMLLRTVQRLSQEDLAKRAGIAKSTLANIETGRHRSRFETERIIAEALHVSHKALLDDETCVLELAALLGVKVYVGPMAPAQEVANLIGRMPPARAQEALLFLRMLAGIGQDSRSQDERDRDAAEEPLREKARKQLERRYKNKSRKQ